MSKLFSSFSFKNLELKIYLVMVPMNMDQAEQEGYANDWHDIHYKNVFF